MPKYGRKEKRQVRRKKTVEAYKRLAIKEHPLPVKDEMQSIKLLPSFFNYGRKYSIIPETFLFPSRDYGECMYKKT